MIEPWEDDEDRATVADDDDFSRDENLSEGDELSDHLDLSSEEELDEDCRPDKVSELTVGGNEGHFTFSEYVELFEDPTIERGFHATKYFEEDNNPFLNVQPIGAIKKKPVRDFRSIIQPLAEYPKELNAPPSNDPLGATQDPLVPKVRLVDGLFELKDSRATFALRSYPCVMFPYDAAAVTSRAALVDRLREMVGDLVVVENPAPAPEPSPRNRKKKKEPIEESAAVEAEAATAVVSEGPLTIGGEDVFCGAVQQAPSGDALVITQHPEIQKILLEKIEGAVLTPVDDVKTIRKFFKEIKHATPPAEIYYPRPLRRKVKKCTVNKDVYLLMKRIEEAGGFSNVRFATVDAEAAVIRRDCIPCPCELAIVGDDFDYHTFVHPGVLLGNDAYTAGCLSICDLGIGHGIPFRNSKLLRTDYCQIASEVYNCTVRPQADGILFFNKGTIMDLNAVRWLFAADYVDRGIEDGEIPYFEMFDVELLSKALGDVKLPPVPKRSPDIPMDNACHYHEEASKLFKSCHCAFDDAVVLFEWLKQVQQLYMEDALEHIDVNSDSETETAATMTASPSSPTGSPTF